MERYNNILLSTKKYKLQRDFWIDYLDDLDNSEIIRKSRMYIKGEPVFNNKHEVIYTLKSDVSEKFIKVGRDSDLTLYIILVSAFMVFIHRYTGREDVFLTSPVYKEDNTDLLNDAIVIRKKISCDMNFTDILFDVRERFINICENQEYPLKKIIEELNSIEEGSYEVLYDLIFSSENIHRVEDIDEIDHKSNLMISFIRREKNITFKFRYDSLCYHIDEINQLIVHFDKVLEVISDDISIKISQIDILTPEEKKMLQLFNDTAVEYPKDKTLNVLFEETVVKNPHVTAVAANGRSLTYKELSEKVNKLAAFLRVKGIKRNDVVGIMIDRSIEMIVAILAILKAGGAYLPIDPRTPENRVISMLEDSNVSTLLTKSNLLMGLSFTALQGLQQTNVVPFKTSKRAQIVNMDSLPIIDRSLVDYEKYHKYIGLTMVKNSITLQATRGCPYNCSYCHKIWPKRHVIRSAENIFEEVMIYYNMGVRRFSFIDDIFNLDVQNSSRFFRMVIESGINIQVFFPAGLRGDILTKEYIDLMVQAGTVNIALALETASPRLQKLIQKNLNLDRLLENINYICANYPHVIIELFTMHGFPTETEEEANMTLEFIKKIKWLHFPYIHVLKIYPNTEMEKLALENGISYESIVKSRELAWHELPYTLPFDRNFSLKYQSEFLDNYFLSKERLLAVLPHQMRVMTEDELVLKYSSYLPIKIKTLDDFLRFVGISWSELSIDRCVDSNKYTVLNLNQKMKEYFPKNPVDGDEFKILLLDLSQHFSGNTNAHYDPIEPPLGPLYLLTYLNKELGDAVNGKIAKSRIDFSSYDELKTLIDEFRPDAIGIRTLNYYKDFFHQTISVIRNWGYNMPIIAGGPYATSMHSEMLSDCNIDLAVLGEGEITFTELIKKIIKNNGELPSEDVLRNIDGIVYMPKNERNDKKYAREIIMIDIAEDKINKQAMSNLKNVNIPEDLAYIIYTSGSTGKPKGTMIEHRNVINLAFGLDDKIFKRYGRNQRVSLVAPYVFDASVQQIFSTLILGNSLYIVPDDVRVDGAKLIQFYQEHSIDISDGTPAHLFLMSEDIKEKASRFKVKHFIIGGEALPQKTVERFLSAFDRNAPIITNVYGPTECCVDSTFYQIDKNNMSIFDRIPIGKPMPNERVYILGKHNDILPLGSIGELCIAGEGVGRGYYGREDLTLEKFIANPFEEDGWLYKTGDLAKWLPDGNIQFNERIDNQVKVRGYRIELGEIENCLLKHKDIKEAVVIAVEMVQPDVHDSSESETFNKCLCAYITLNRPLDEQELRSFLASDLQDYMIPSYFVTLEKMPLTTSGKVNRNSLPKIQDYMLVSTTENYALPRNEFEEKLVECWESILGKSPIGINDNFFMIGGDSIKTIQTISRMKKEGYQIDVRDIFKYPTISGLSSIVRKCTHICDQSPVSGVIPLTPIQCEFFSNKVVDNHHYNQSVIIQFSEKIDSKLIMFIFNKIQEHHDALRITYKVDDGNIIQYNNDVGLPISLFEYNLYEVVDPLKEFNRKVYDIQANINLSNGPLMQLGLFHMDDKDQLLITIHHLVIDGVSWRILFEDIVTLYSQYKKGEKAELQFKTNSFKDWAIALSKYADSEVFLREKSYWRQLEEKSKYVPLIKRDYDCEHIIGDNESLLFNLTEEQTDNLLTRVNEAFGTEITEILLIALGLSIKKIFGYNRVLVTLEGHGREQIVDGIDINRTIGWFTSSYPVLLELSYYTDMSRQIKEIKEYFKRIPSKGIGYGILKYLTNNANKEELNFYIKPQICFNYLGQVDSDINNNGLFKVTDNSSGSNESSNMVSEFEFDISGIVFEKKLQIIISYSKKQYLSKTVKKLIDTYKSELLNIIDFCLKKAERSLSPSDLGYKDIGIDELESFFD